MATECQVQRCTSTSRYSPLPGGVKVCLVHKHAWLVFERWAAIARYIPWALKKGKKPKK